MLFDRVCKSCTKEFKSNRSDASTCYACALRDIAGRNPPEEGDFNSALMISGEMSEKEWQWLQEDLWEVDKAAHACDKCGQMTCQCPEYPDDDFDEDDFVEEKPEEYHCYGCGVPVDSIDQVLCEGCWLKEIKEMKREFVRDLLRFRILSHNWWESLYHYLHGHLTRR